MDKHRPALSFIEARTSVLASASRLTPREVDLDSAHGHVLAESVFATTSSPPFATSAMDGYALRSGDVAKAGATTPIRLPVVGDLAAGSSSLISVEPGTCVRIMTGAAAPSGADAVIPHELVSIHRMLGPEEIEVDRVVPVGANIRSIGEDFRQGDALIAAGTVPGPAHLGLLASNGVTHVNVIPRPRVALITIGDELVDHGSPITTAQIRDSNAVMIGSLITQFGAELVARHRVGDTLQILRNAIDSALAAGADLVVTVGSASQSARDVMSDLTGDGFDLTFADVSMKPGKPLVFGTVHGIPLIGLPGNPAAAFVSAWQFVRPTIRTLAGHEDLDLPEVTAISTIDIRDQLARRCFFRARLRSTDDGTFVESAGSQSSASQLALTNTNGFVVLAEDVESIARGDTVRVQVLDDRLLIEQRLPDLSPVFT